MYSNRCYSKYKLEGKSFSKSVFLFKRNTLKQFLSLGKCSMKLFICFLSLFTISFPRLLLEQLRHTCYICFLSPFTIRVAQAYVNQKKLDTETKILQANASQFCRQTTQWLKLVEDFNTALKVANRLCCMWIIM